jgi:hypothetical protein
MILHAATLAAFLVDQIQQAPIVVQCVQKDEPESWAKWLPTIVQTVVSLASITAGVLIAWRSFLATSEKDHRRWLLDQKKAEWRELLDVLGRTYFPLALAAQSGQGLPTHHVAVVNRAMRIMKDRLFIDETARRTLFKKFEDFAKVYQFANPPNVNAMIDLLQLIEDARGEAKKDISMSTDETKPSWFRRGKP